MPALCNPRSDLGQCFSQILKCIYTSLFSDGYLNGFEKSDQNASVPGANSVEWVISKILCYSSAVGLMRSYVNEGTMNS